MSPLSYVASLCVRCVGAVRSMAGDTGRTGSRSSAGYTSRTQDAGDRTLLVVGQLLWMAVTLALLFVLELLSTRLYFIVSFIGLLCNRVLFAPRGTTGQWWQVVNAITWLCFAVLSYIIYLRVMAAPS